MAMPTAQEAAQRWVAAGTQGTERYKQGVSAVQVSPGALAARAVDLWAANTVAAKPKFAANSAKVTKEAWVAAAAGKGADRYAPGIQAAQGSYEAALSKLLPYIAQQVSSLPPRGGLEANITRMTSFVRGMSKYSK